MIRFWLNLIILTLIPFFGFTQKENAYWFFGDGAGISFYPKAKTVTGGRIFTREGCATISDRKTGELLFYTDGQTVWDANHNIMPNGTNLIGNTSTTQGAVIVPNPADKQKYYIFTAGHSDMANNQLYYTEVNMSSGSGQIIAATKNTRLLNNLSEKIICAKHENNQDYWLITHTLENNAFYIYPITKRGIGTPNICRLGMSLSTELWDKVGTIKVSNNGKKIAHANAGTSMRVEILDFNATTGIISEPVITINAKGMAYAVEFSPNDNLLYLAETNAAYGSFSGIGRVCQYDISSNNETLINQSRIELASNAQIHYGALQLASDCRIYIAKEQNSSGLPYLAVINRPNIRGYSCIYEENGFYLDGKNTRLGLPSIVGGFPLSIDSIVANNCQTLNRQFDVIYNGTADSVKWNFDDPLSGESNISYIKQVNHLFTKAGNYNIMASVYSDCCVDTIYKTISVTDNNLNLGNDTVVCNDSEFQLNAYIPNAVSYLWQNGTTTPNYKPTKSGQYSVVINTSDYCLYYDTINVELIISSSRTVSKDVLCNGYDDGSITIFSLPENVKYSYSLDNLNFYNSNQFNNLKAGNYKVIIRDSNNCIEIKNDVLIKEPEKLELKSLEVKNISCYGNIDGAIAFEIVGGTKDYNTVMIDGLGRVISRLDTLSSGIYSMNVTDKHGCKLSSSVRILEPSKLTLNLKATPITCNGYNDGAIISTVGGGFESLPYNYLWSNDNKTANINQLLAGEYKLIVKDANGCIAKDSLILPEPQKLTIKFEATHVTCNGGYDGTITSSITGGIDSLPYNYFWSNNSKSSNIYRLFAGNYKLKVNDINGCMVIDSVNIIQPTTIVANLSPKDITCYGSADGKIDLNIEGGSNGLLYNWEHGSNQRNLTNLPVGNYNVTVTDTLLHTCAIAYTEIQQPPELQIFVIDTIMSVNSASNGEIEVSVTGGAGDYTLEWSNGSSSKRLINLQQGSYGLTVTDANQCETKIAVTIVNYDCLVNSNIPNVFTPNNDGLNDYFKIDSERYTQFNAQIINRWGMKVYEWYDTEDWWDGTYMKTGKAVSPGIYYYVVTIQCYNNDIFEAKGFLHLVRDKQ